jgi:hypothetical protein
LNQKAALTEPPEMESFRIASRRSDISQERVVREEGFDHRT